MRLRHALAFLALPVLLSKPVFARGRVVFTDPCLCAGNHGVARWAAKTDPEKPPLNISAIQQITPADICAWEGLGARPSGAERLPLEKKWYAVEGRILAVKAEEDGDIHIEMGNVDQRKGRIIVELPVGDTWCEMRKTAFSWTDAQFPIKPGQFKTTQHPIVTVIGKAFYDTEHAGKDLRNNDRGKNTLVAVWEIHPVMQLTIGNAKVSAAPPQIQPQVVPQSKRRQAL